MLIDYLRLERMERWEAVGLVLVSFRLFLVEVDADSGSGDWEVRKVAVVLEVFVASEKQDPGSALEAVVVVAAVIVAFPFALEAEMGEDRVLGQEQIQYQDRFASASRRHPLALP